MGIMKKTAGTRRRSVPAVRRTTVAAAVAMPVTVSHGVAGVLDLRAPSAGSFPLSLRRGDEIGRMASPAFGGAAVLLISTQ